MSAFRHDGPAVRVPAAYVRTLASAVEAAGHDSAGFLATESLTRGALGDLDTISAALFGRLYRRAILLLDDESLGMASGGRTASGTFRMMCLCVIGCPTLGAIVRRAGEFIDVCRTQRLKPELAFGADEARIGFALAAHASDASLEAMLADEGPMKVRTSLYLWFNLLGWFGGRVLPLRAVEFSFAAPSHGGDWHRLFGCDVRFGAGRNALVLPAHAMALPSVQDERTLEDFLRETPYRLMVPSFVPPSLEGRLRTMLVQISGEPPPTAEAMAKRLGLSVSTLRRRLGEEGTSWMRLKEEGRKAAGLRYLADTDLPLAEIALLLGFTDTGTFFRAFRRWTHSTPTRYRQALRTGDRRFERKRN